MRCDDFLTAKNYERINTLCIQTLFTIYFHFFGDFTMKRILNFVLVVGITAWVAACSSGTDSGTGSTTQQDATGGLAGTWISSTADVAPLFKIALATDSILATFKTDGSYSATSYSAKNGNAAYTGAYTVTKGTRDTLGATIYTIDIRQATPSVARVQGIYVVQTSVTPARMLYEVVQTETPAGTPPTVTSGFGATKDVTGRVLATLGLSNVQVYRKR
jgi:hypothetical protein